ncbi:hypothetical protein [Spirillospora albida]|uniref:hypothetical protein n=1 Tax=Spirillospora albida TaxID=58123 RepID=UPI0004BFB3DE|nr:hypothetical protein [Spirillospora albida]
MITGQVPAEAARIQDRYHGVKVWFGKQTQSWWAYVPYTRLHQPGLYEGGTTKALDEAIRAALGWRAPTEKTAGRPPGMWGRP